MSSSLTRSWLRSTVGVLAVILAAGCDDPPIAGPQLDAIASGDGQIAGADASLADGAVGDAANQTDGPGTADVPTTAIGKACASNVDCAAAQLKCFETNPATGAGLCSRACASSGDCDPGTYCNPLGQGLACTPARYCNPCASDGDCSPAAPLCLASPSGPKLCTLRCTLGDATCGPGASCEQFGEKLDDFACMPDYGACTGDGAQCSPCAGPADCKTGSECYFAKDTGERFCAQLCDVTPCPTGYGCATVKPDGSPTKKVCLKLVGTKTVGTCAKGDKGFCDSCTADHECASNKCASKNGKKFCAQPGTCSKATEATDCPYGGEATFCVPSDKGMICAPPPSWHCQGFKACLGHACSGKEVCVEGICKPAP